MPAGPVRYQSALADSGRWIGFPYRDGDIVISTQPRTGTTWVQMICALLIFQDPELPSSLGWISPWLDRVIYPRDELLARLAGQHHRRFIKTHTPLDGIPLDPRATYIVTGRHPLDAAVSRYYHRANINRQQQIPGQPVREWLEDWIGHNADPRQDLDSLPGFLWHSSDAWARRGEPNIVLVHYDDLSADLGRHMRTLATRLGIAVPEHLWPDLVQAATFDHMRDRAEQITGASSILRSSTAFFRRGSPGAGREILAELQLARYHAMAEALAPPDLLSWLHRPHKVAAQPIVTGRLTLVPLSVQHADEMAAVLADPGLYAFTGGSPPTSEELRARYERWIAGSPDPAVSWCNWVIQLRGQRRLAGAVQATITAGDELVAEVAWVVGTSWQGQGVATEAARALIGWLGQQRVRTIIAHIHPRHHASAAVAAAAGLSPTGQLHDGECRWRLAAPAS